MRGTRKDYAHFISIARGSLAETEAFLLLIQRLELGSGASVETALNQAGAVGRMLTKLRRSLTAPKSPNTHSPTPNTP